MSSNENNSHTRDGAKRRGVSLGPQASQILQRLYEPQLGSASPTGKAQQNVKHSTSSVLKPEQQTRMKQTASVTSLAFDPLVSTRNPLLRSVEAAPPEMRGSTLMSSASVATILTPEHMHPTLLHATEKTCKLHEKSRATASAISLRDPALVASSSHPNHDEVMDNNSKKEQTSTSPSKVIRSPSTKAAQRRHIPVHESFTASLHLDPRYLHEFHASNFLYLRKKRDSDLVMYALEVVEHYDADRSNYFTMSLEGITHFTRHDGSEFWPLDKWEREYTRFMKMLAIPFFQKYKLWKNFMMWKQSARTFKMRNAKKALNDKLFLLTPSLQTTLLGLRGLCLDVENLELICFKPKKTY
ncbi:hypothetical protein FI667_g2115, partial [Globisporangium splendens]